MKKIFYVFVPLIICISSCEHDPLYTPIDVEDPNDDVDDIEGCDPDKIYFVNDVMPIITSNCITCHGGSSIEDGVDFSTYQGIMEEVDAFDALDSEIYEVITEDDPDKIMPPPPNNPLTAEQIAIIKDWINQGATNEECTNTDCDVADVTFSQSVWPIIQNSCVGCHSGGSPQGGLSLSNYSEIAQYAGNGALSGVINHDDGYLAMPYNGEQLSQCEIDTIDEWINSGYPDN